MTHAPSNSSDENIFSTLSAKYAICSERSADSIAAVTPSGLDLSFSPRVSVFTLGLQPRHQIHHRLVTFILKWTVGSMVRRRPILQTCNVVVVLKQRLASFQQLRSSSP